MLMEASETIYTKNDNVEVLSDNNELSQSHQSPILEYLKLFNISADSIDTLHNIEIPRETLLDLTTYQKAQEHILHFRNIFSSSYLTSLQSTAAIHQKWPLINLTRQILKAYGFHLEPKRRAAGYSEDGTKLYKRVFIIRSK